MSVAESPVKNRKNLCYSKDTTMPRSKRTEPVKRVTLDLPEDLYNRLSDTAKERQQTLVTVATNALDKGLPSPSPADTTKIE